MNRIYYNIRIALLIVALQLITLSASAKAPQVVTDIPAVYSLTASVMGTVGTPHLLLDSQISPHDAALKPSHASLLKQADLVIWIGDNFTPWLSSALPNIAPEAVSLKLSEATGTNKYAVRDIASFEHGEDHDEHEQEHHDKHDARHDNDDGHGHVHSGYDQHMWLDPVNAILWLDAIANELARLDFEQELTYRRNAAAAARELELLSGELALQLAQAQDHKFVVFHDAYQYFEKRFGLQTLGSFAVSDATKPSVARLVWLREQIEAHGVRCIFSEPQFNAERLAAAIADDKLQLGKLDPVGFDLPADKDLYARLLRNLADGFMTCLAPT